MTAEKLLTARGLTKSYARSGADDVVGDARFVAVHGVDLDVFTGETLARAAAARPRWRGCCYV